ncbi:uncharacterized protein N7498_006530 [Penicillium cinerascens]|uniref:Uncharacterized protein n=1 Tax=Penicillium cinerascens TaxID=70096 RepID=A0A9W9MIE1_9EURO|nr:uncharacterized protein N7498_006530 [Penicillium cinerascens]KAJ5201867.1 hypothetical protein N7498_006530 [Penicillium cinerascens]
MVEAVAEGHVLPEKSGLGSAALHEHQLFFPGVYTSYSRRIITVNYWNRNEVTQNPHLDDYENAQIFFSGKSLFLADLARKDAKHAMSLARLRWEELIRI